MRTYRSVAMLAALYVSGGWASAAELPHNEAIATVDLASAAGAALLDVTWRYAPARIVEAEFFAPDADGQPSTTRALTHDIEPKAGVAGFDDSGWQVLAPEALATRQGAGRFSLNWYRTKLTLPERIGGYQTRGATVVLRVTVDDYAEIWVDGEIARHAGQAGGSVIAGWNAENRIVLARNAMPGREIELAIFGANGPLSNPPSNYVWIRSASVELYPGDGQPTAIAPSEVNVEVVRNDPEMDLVIGRNPKAYKLADGFVFTEGPVWLPEDGGSLLFSDPNANTIYRYSDTGTLSVFRTPSGYSGADIAEYGQPGSNGLTLDPNGRLTINEHGNHRVSRLEADGRVTVLVDRYRGKRLNSPNDLVYRSDGSLYFTDPPFGLPRFADDPRKELPFSGVYRLRGEQLTLLTTELSGPNGIALSPDEHYLYVGNWDEQRKIVMRYHLRPDGTAATGQVFADLTNMPGADAIDGIKVDVDGRVYVSGPGGISVFAADRRLLGTIVLPAQPHNFAFGGADGKTLYLTAVHGLYKLRLEVPGVHAAQLSRKR